MAGALPNTFATSSEQLISSCNASSEKTAGAAGIEPATYGFGDRD